MNHHRNEYISMINESVLVYRCQCDVRQTLNSNKGNLGL